MSTFRHGLFTKAETLKEIQPENLHLLLNRHGEFFRNHGVDLGRPSGEDLSYEAIARALMDPDESAPLELVDDLHIITAMATPEGMDALLAEIGTMSLTGQIKFDLGASPTPADVAVKVRLVAPDVIERRLAERILTSKRSFQYFQAKPGSAGAWQEPSDQTMGALQRALDDQFEEMKRGRHTKVYCFPKADGVWFLVRHGDPCKREGAIKGGDSASVYYRPERYDVLCYDEQLGELRINAENKKIRDLYRAQFGLHFFGNAQQFPGSEKYTLEPLRADGEDSLVCSDVRGMEWVRLKEIHYYRGGPEGEVEIRRSSDVFSTLNRRGRRIDEHARIMQAGFLVKFEDSKTARTVTIHPSSVARYSRDSDAVLIEEWLTKRGFMAGAASKDERGTAALAHA